jgi:elongation factor G
MPKYNTEAIRSVAFVGHGAAGKTTLTEALLAKAGAISAPGSVEAGNTVSDFDPLEKSYGHSLNSSLVNFAWRGVHVHLIDTPGYPDFSGQAISALAGVDTAVMVVNAQSGIELNTIRMMKWAAARGLCRMIVINKIDAENVDLPGSSPRSGVVRKSACRSTFPPTGTAGSSTVSSIPTANRISRP